MNNGIPTSNMDMQMGMFPIMPGGGRCTCHAEIRRLDQRIEMQERQIRLLTRRVDALDSHLPRPRPFEVNTNMGMEATMSNEYPQTGNYML